jgi:hypothetical protein
MTGVSERAGWWLASDGEWYPPHLRPANRTTSRTSSNSDVAAGQPDTSSAREAPPSGWVFKPLPYGGRCRTCHRQIEKKEEGWHNPAAPPNRKVICSSCWSAANVEQRTSVPTPHQRRVGGASVLRDSVTKGRQKRTWQHGAAGEYLVGLTLSEQLGPEQVVLVDLSVPDSQANIDFLVVAASGVWLIDAKNWSGRISYRPPSLLSTSLRLYVGDADRTDAIDDIYALVIPVANIINDPKVPIHPALVFVNGDWDPKMLLRRKPWQHNRVWITPPRMLTKLIKGPGPLSQDEVIAIARQLGDALPQR